MMKYLRAYNESFSNESELKEALEIYAEELPFEMHDIDLFVTPPRIMYPFSNTDAYKITYTHIDSSLDAMIADLTNDITVHYGSDIEKIKNKVKEIVAVAFTKFAKKYDMIFLVDKKMNPTVTIIDEDPNREFAIDIIVEFWLTAE